MKDWRSSNLQLRADRNFVNETARKAAEAREVVTPAEPWSREAFLALSGRFADQQREMAAQAERHGWH